MGSADGSQKRKSIKRPKLNFFFLEGELHKRLASNTGKDTITTWNYPQGRKIIYVYTDVLKRYKAAFTTKQVTEMVNRSRRTLENILHDEKIERPSRVYSIDERRRFYMYMWSEEDIMELHSYLATVHRGRPRKDGEIGPAKLPTPRELRAIIRGEQMLYVRHGDAFVPTWKATEI